MDVEDEEEEEDEVEDDYEEATELFNFLNEKDDNEDTYYNDFMDEMCVWDNVSMFSRE